MTLPGQTITVLDPGLGFVQIAADTPLVTGTCSGGVVGTLYSFSNLSTVRSTLIAGDLAEDVARKLVERGGPILAMKTTGSVAATSSAVVKTGTGTPVPTIAGTATMRTNALVTVKVGGALGTAQFVYTLDNFQPASVNPTTSTQRTIPSGGTYLFPNTGVTMTFPAGTYVAGDTFAFTTEPPHSNAADLAAAAAVIAATPGASFKQWTLAETFTTATEAFTMATALGSQLQALQTAFRYSRGMCDAGSADTKTNVITARAAFSDRRVSTAYGYEITTSALPFEGYANRYASCVSSIGARAARVVASTDLARYAEGSLAATLWIAFDSNLDSTIDAANISSLRTWSGVPGFYIANGYLSSAPGSDFIYWQFGRLMDIGCQAIYGAMLQFVADDLRTLPAGTLDPLDAAVVNTAGNDALRTALIAPKNARGRPGLVSAVDFEADLTNNLNSSSTLNTTTAIQPRGYSRFISQTIGYALNV